MKTNKGRSYNVRLKFRYLYLNEHCKNGPEYNNLKTKNLTAVTENQTYTEYMYKGKYE